MINIKGFFPNMLARKIAPIIFSLFQTYLFYKQIGKNGVEGPPHFLFAYIS